MTLNYLKASGGTEPSAAQADVTATHFYQREGWAFRIKPRNGCTSWDVWHLDPSGPAVAMGFCSKKDAIDWLDRQVNAALR